MEMMYGFEGKAFLMAQVRQRECLKDSGRIDMSHLDDYDILGAVGKVSNPRPESYAEGKSQDAWKEYWDRHVTWYVAPELPASLCVKDAQAEQELYY